MARNMQDVKLEDLSDAEFRDLVDREIRKDHPQTSKEDRTFLQSISPKLRHPSVINRWIMVLETMKASAETQLGAKRSELKKTHEKVTEAEYLERVRTYQHWKAGNVRFLNSVQQRLLEARFHRLREFGTLYPTRLAEERNAASSALTGLVKAIENHRHTVLAEYDPTDADEALWATIEATLRSTNDCCASESCECADRR